MVASLVVFLDWPRKSLDCNALLQGEFWGLEPNPTGAVVITGCSGGGIGRHAAETLAAKGHRIFCSVRKEAHKAELDALGLASLTTLLMDVTKPEEVEVFVESVLVQTKEEGITIAGVVNNAGISKHVPIEFSDIDVINNVLDVNLHGVLRVTRALLPSIRNDRGRVINIGSVKGVLAPPGTGAYGFSKYALEALTDSLRVELIDYGVSVSMVNPGYIKTKIGPKQYSGANRPHQHLSDEQVQSTELWWCGATVFCFVRFLLLLNCMLIED